MSEQKKDIRNEEIKKQQPEKINTGILKEKEEKDIEDRLVDTLKDINKKLTKKEIKELLSKLEAAKWLDWLKDELKKSEVLAWKEISDDVINDILNLISQSKEIASKNIQELKLEIAKINESPEYTVNQKIYLTNKFPWIKKLEESELGKNLIIDIAWVAVWAIDSAQAIFKLLLWLIWDIFTLPRDITKNLKKKD